MLHGIASTWFPLETNHHAPPHEQTLRDTRKYDPAVLWSFVLFHDSKNVHPTYPLQYLQRCKVFFISLKYHLSLVFCRLVALTSRCWATRMTGFQIQVCRIKHAVSRLVTVGLNGGFARIDNNNILSLPSRKDKDVFTTWQGS